ncbi:pyridoxamine 5'-phosphate oxidase family protein [Acidovorax cavernicola]|uniref:Pyridoxamine 5'-phosphate oxidase n=1 Tax=Acidovorax cavernicola TaxID=1675792 RepID=A0A9X8CYP7_9BURK|nr:pyridoxamine 5'-phosphate oxidase family protein [Acidovorax cavernicola]RIX72486.1 pyridoxamine 5'-phosphate oxidase [Acidovorax cavernicola]
MTLAPRPTQTLRVLLHTRRTATLGTQSLQNDEAPGLALVPYAIDGQGECLVLLVSGSAAHARQMIAHSEVSLLVAQSDAAQQVVHVHERVAIVGQAMTPTPGSAAWGSARHAYLRRFPEAASMAKLGDFRIVCITPQQARHVAGYGATRNVDQTELRALMASAH